MLTTMLSTTSHRGEDHANRASLTLPLSNPDWFPSLPTATRSVAAPPVPLAAEDAPVRAAPAPPAPQKTKLLGLFSAGSAPTSASSRVAPKPPNAVGLAPTPLGSSPPKQRPAPSFATARSSASAFHSTTATANHGISWSALAQPLWQRSSAASPPPMTSLAPRPIDHRMSSSTAAPVSSPLPSASKLLDGLRWTRSSNENHSRPITSTKNAVSSVVSPSRSIAEPVAAFSKDASLRPRPPMPISSSPPESVEEDRFASLRKVTSNAAAAADANGKGESRKRFPLPLDVSELPTVSPLLKPNDGEFDCSPITPAFHKVTDASVVGPTGADAPAPSDGVFSGIFSGKQKSDVWASSTAHATLPTFTVTGSTEHTTIGSSTEAAVDGIQTPTMTFSSPVGVHYYDPLSADGLLAASQPPNPAFSLENPFEQQTTLHFSTDPMVNIAEPNYSTNNATELNTFAQNPAALGSSTSNRIDEEDDHLDALKLLLQSVMSISAEEATHPAEETVVSPLRTWEGSGVLHRRAYTERVTTFSTMPQWSSQNSGYKAAFYN